MSSSRAKPHNRAKLSLASMNRPVASALMAMASGDA
jgi:hypothetical protein